jgi:hypothetical protein
MRNPYNYTRIDSPTKLPAGKNFCIIEEDSYSTDGGYPESGSSSYSYCAIKLYKDEKDWREAAEEMTKENMESTYGRKRVFSPVIINKAKLETKINISIDMAA